MLEINRKKSYLIIAAAVWFAALYSLAASTNQKTLDEEQADPLSQEIKAAHHEIHKAEQQQLDLRIKETLLRMERQKQKLAKAQQAGDSERVTLTEENIEAMQKTLASLQQIKELQTQIHDARKQKDYAKADSLFHDLQAMKDLYSNQEMGVLVSRQKLYLGTIQQACETKLKTLDEEIQKTEQDKNQQKLDLLTARKKELERASQLVDDLSALLPKMKEAREQDNEDTLTALLEQAQDKKKELQKLLQKKE